MRPQMISSRGVDKLRGDAHLVAVLAHAALEHCTNVELTRDVGDIRILTLEGEGGRARRDLELRNRGERVQELLGKAVGEIVLLGIAAHVDKRQDGNRVRWCWGLDPAGRGRGGR